MPRFPGIWLVPTTVMLAAIVACGDDASEGNNTGAGDDTGQATSPPPVDLAGAPAIFVGAGDIAACGSDEDELGDERVAALLDGIAGTVFTLGDNAYPDGTAGQFESCYEPSWGRHRARTRPAPGNHDYNTSDATPYYEYFGPNAGDAGKGYYSFDIGAWHAISLNSNCSEIDGGCGPGSPQQTWLEADLKAHPNACTIAYWHHPVLTIGPHDNDEETLPLWQTLYDHGTDIVLSGHEHNYQRYAPLDRDAAAVDADEGIRFFVVGTGGVGLTDASSSRVNDNPGLEAWGDNPGDGDSHDASLGVLNLSLYDAAYEWQFVPAEGGTFTDSGRGTCHGPSAYGAAPHPSLSLAHE